MGVGSGERVGEGAGEEVGERRGEGDGNGRGVEVGEGSGVTVGGAGALGSPAAHQPTKKAATRARTKRAFFQIFTLHSRFQSKGLRIE